MTITARLRRAVAVGLLAPGLAGACDFVEPTASDPNVVPNATIDQHFPGIQVNTWFLSEGSISRYTSMWVQQMAGTDRQYTTIGQYVFTQEDVDDPYNALYTGGGLIDIKRALATERAQTDRIYAGILKVYQALMFGIGAATFGDLPYSQAADPEFPTPELDGQLEIYAALQALLDEAIADLQSGAGPGPGAVDISFGGDAAKWVAVAHTLKARLHSHLAELEPGRYAQVLAEAQQGIQTASGNWLAIHSTAETELNTYFQFQRDRQNYWTAGAFLVDLMKARGDPRLEIYFAPVDGEIIGSDPGGGVASPLNEALGSPGAQDFDVPLLTCEENAFLAAEAAYALGDAATGATWVERGIACSEAFWGVDLPGPAANTLEEAILQKFMALFLSSEIWQTYKRTCLPAVETFQGLEVPGRFFYSDDEEETNPNILPADQQPERNANDPSPCP